MGIPKFFSWYSGHQIFRATINKAVPPNVDIFAIDMNALIYNNLDLLDIKVIREQGILVFSQEELYRRRYEVFQGVFRDVIGLTQTIRPRRSLIMAFDGVAPQAKINQQRSRRYKAAANRQPDAVFDTNSITPGTDFMFDLDQFIRRELQRIASLTPEQARRDPYATVLPPNIVYSSHLVPGEGEHKIADHLRAIPSSGQTVVVHGMDADLIMIYLLRLRQDWENIYLFREHKLEGRGGVRNYAVETMINLRALERVIRALYPGVPDPVDDFVTITFLIGNDFLPHFPSFERIYDALDTIIFGYSQYLADNQTGPVPAQGLTSPGSINWRELARFFEYVTTRYDDTLLQRWAENTDAQIKFPSAVAERCITTSRIVGTQSRCVRTLDIPMFKTEWYKYVFGPKTGKGTITPTQDDINNLIKSYLEGMAWVHSYYLNGQSAVNVGWFYPNHYAPLFSDLHTYIMASPTITWEVNPLQIFSETVTPPEQLVMVLPPASLTTVPPPLRPLYSEQSPIFDLLPTGFKVDAQGKMEEWESIAILPIPNPNRVRRAVMLLGLPPQFFARFAPQEPLVIERDFVRTMAASRGGGRGRGDRGGRGGPRGGGRGRRGPRGRGGRGQGAPGRGRSAFVLPTIPSESVTLRQTLL